MSTQEPDDSTAESDDDIREIAEADGQFSAIVDTDTLAVVLDALDAASDEAVWEIAAEGINGLNVDPAKVMMCELTVWEDAFESYDPTPVDIGVNLQTFRDAALAGDVTEIGLDAEEHKINVTSGPIDAALGPIVASSIVTQRVSQDVIDGTEATWTMPAETFKDAIAHASKFGGNTLQLHAGDGFHGVRKPGDTDDVDVAFDADAVEWEYEPEGRQIVLLSQDYLQKIRRAIPKDTDVTFSAATDWPFVIEYTSHGVDVQFVVAPRLEN